MLKFDNNISLENVIVNIPVFIQSLITEFKKPILVKNINFKFNCKLKNEVYCKINPNLLFWSLQEIIKNSLEALNQTGEIILQIDTDPDSLVISVKDNGCGILRSIIHRVFDPEFSFGKTECNIGNGLNYTKKIVNSFDGDVVVSSSKDEGTIVMIYLPII